jgi:hypothetical protein
MRSEVVASHGHRSGTTTRACCESAGGAASRGPFREYKGINEAEPGTLRMRLR